MTGPPSTQTVVVLDDDPIVRTAILKTLSVLGLETVGCVSEPEVMALIRDQRPKLLIIDQMLGGDRSGWEIAQAVRDRLPGVPVLMVTGVPSTELQAAVDAAPRSRLMAKPFSINALTEAIFELCEHD